jgi:hypothetical protein
MGSLELLIDLDPVLAVVGSIPTLRMLGDEMHGPIVGEGTWFVRTSMTDRTGQRRRLCRLTTGF